MWLLLFIFIVVFKGWWWGNFSNFGIVILCIFLGGEDDCFVCFEEGIELSLVDLWVGKLSFVKGL